MQAKDRIVLALDVDNPEKALELVSRLKDHVGAFKIGMQLYNSVGPDILEKINEGGSRVFLDLKFHDIPNTVGAVSRVAARRGCWMFNVHAAGGAAMMTAAAQSSREEASKTGKNPPLVLGVTVLTSLSQDQLNAEIGIPGSVEEVVSRWALLAKESGLDGVVASPREVKAIRQTCGNDFLIVTPGVRPLWAGTQDQKRVTTPREAVDSGADYLVIGRPITGADDPIEAAQRIIKELEE
ncbi:MAG: orotidine-5'-phosphate decarboxylase [Syntrophomonadaceae bacterium]|nr:orotidine-5'-phosphate decarboxylase [Syntrophomonadaceae bacterium]